MNSNLPNITDWIAALSSVASVLVAFAGLYLGFRKFETWKSEQLAQSKREVAAAILASVDYIELELRIIRHPLALAAISTIQKRHARLYDLETEFRSLILMRTKAKALLADVHVDADIKKLLEARNELVMAIENVMEAEGSGNPVRQDEFELADRKVAFGDFKTNDEFGNRLTQTCSSIRERLEPVIRLERL